MLGVGSHVDHQLAFMTGRCLADLEAEVWAYEDLLYAIHTPSSRDVRLQEVAGAVGETAQH